MSRESNTAAIYAKYASLFELFHGGMPIGLMAAYAEGESGGKMSAPGDASLAEYGIFQLPAAEEKRFGLPSGFRTTLEGNFFLAGLAQNVDAMRVALAYPQYMQVGSQDNWLYAHLVFAVGYGGVQQLLKAVDPTNGYSDMLAYAATGNTINIGRIASDKVALRIQTMVSRWNIGAASGVSMDYGTPVVPPFPDGVDQIALPKYVQGKIEMASAGFGGWLGLLLLLGIGWYYSSMRS